VIQSAAPATVRRALAGSQGPPTPRTATYTSLASELIGFTQADVLLDCAPRSAAQLTNDRWTAPTQALGAAGAVEMLLVLLHESMTGQATTLATRAAVAEQTRATALARLRRWVSDDAQSVVLLGSEDASLAADGLLVDMTAVRAKKENAAAVAVAESVGHPDGSLLSDCVTHDFMEHNTVRSGDEWMVRSPHPSHIPSPCTTSTRSAPHGLFRPTLSKPAQHQRHHSWVCPKLALVGYPHAQASPRGGRVRRAGGGVVAAAVSSRQLRTSAGAGH
jgi:hypothetical protein